MSSAQIAVDSPFTFEMHGNVKMERKTCEKWVAKYK